MKAQIQIFLLLTAFTLVTGCAGFISHSDPLAGWHVSDVKNLDANKAITDDYQSYIQKLSAKERLSAGPIFYYEDGTGQHAVRITIGINGTWWQHVLIYDKDNKRIKTVKYSSGGYQS